MDSENILKICSRGDLKHLKVFLNDLNREQIESIRDKNLASCLHYAGRNGCLKILEYLIIEKNVCPFLVSEVGATCLHDAAVKGRIDVIEWLLKNTSLTTSFKDSNGATIWHLASKFDQLDLIDWLIEFEGNKGAKSTTFNGATCLHFAASSGSFRSLRRLAHLVPGHLNTQMMNGVTPVYLAIQEGNVPMVKYLILSGADIDLRAEDGMNGIHVACQNGDLDMVRLLVEDCSADLNEKDFNGATPLHYACVNGNSKLVAYLLSNKAEIKRDKFGNTPLHDTALGGHLECARLLISNNCDVSIKDSEGMSASDIAESNGFKQLTDEIRKFEQKATSQKQLKQQKMIDRSVRKSPNVLSVQSPLFTDLSGVTSSTPSSDPEKSEEVNKINSKTYTKNQTFVVYRSDRPTNYYSQTDLTQVSAIDELDKCIAEYDADVSRLTTKIYVDSSMYSSGSNKTLNKYDSELMSPDQNNNVSTFNFHSGSQPPPAPPMPISWSNKENKTPYGMIKPADRTRKTFNFMDELNNQLKKKNEEAKKMSNSKFEETLESIKKVTEYRVLKQTSENSKIPEWKRQLIEKKKMMRQNFNE